MRNLLRGEYPGTVDGDFRVTIPKNELLEKMALDRARRCILAGKSEDCVSLWTHELWHSEIQPRIDAILQGRHAVVRIDHLRTVSGLVDNLDEGTVDEKGRIRLPPDYESLVEQAKHKGKLRNVVTMVGCGLCIEIWRPSAWEEFRKTLWPKFWEAIDAVTAAAPSGG